MSAEPPQFDAEAVIDAMTPLLDIAIRPEFRPGIVANLRVTARFAAIVQAAELDDDAEPAPVFVP